MTHDPFRRDHPRNLNYDQIKPNVLPSNRCKSLRGTEKSSQARLIATPSIELTLSRSSTIFDRHPVPATYWGQFAMFVVGAACSDSACMLDRLLGTTVAGPTHAMQFHAIPVKTPQVHQRRRGHREEPQALSHLRPTPDGIV